LVLAAVGTEGWMESRRLTIDAGRLLSRMQAERACR
jgi:hypothetical protein